MILLFIILRFVSIEVTSVYDADTFRGNILYVNHWIARDNSFRVWGIDAPERGWRADCDYEYYLAEEATLYAKDRIQDTIFCEIVGKDKYGRWLVNLPRYNSEMIACGYAQPYYGKKKINWCYEY